MSGTLRVDGAHVMVTMLPISAGDATLIVWSDGPNRRTVLVDAGLGRFEALNYLKSVGIFHLDLIILSHPDLDHLGGLPEILKDPVFTVDRIWCFDLGFLRQFIVTGQIPPPTDGTHEVVYDYALRSTLDQFSDVLKAANGKGVQVLQVSEGHRQCIGGVLLEVLYPPDDFYRCLRNPVAIKRLLRRKIPEDWEGDAGSEDGNPTALQLSQPQDRRRLTDGVQRPDMPDAGVHLSDLEEKADEDQLELEQGGDGDGERLPWKLVGTLYNNMSIVVKATVLGGIRPPSILLTGDLSDWTTLVARHWHRIGSDVLKVPHHGSKKVACDIDWILQGGLDWPWPWLIRRYRIWTPIINGQTLADVEALVGKLRQSDPHSVLHELVGASHALVFPHPQHGLPSYPLSTLSSNVVANRQDRGLDSLSDPLNPPAAARLLIGMEQHEISEHVSKDR